MIGRTTNPVALSNHAKIHFLWGRDRSRSEVGDLSGFWTNAKQRSASARWEANSLLPKTNHILKAEFGWRGKRGRNAEKTITPKPRHTAASQDWGWTNTIENSLCLPRAQYQSTKQKVTPLCSSGRQGRIGTLRKNLWALLGPILSTRCLTSHHWGNPKPVKNWS